MATTVKCRDIHDAVLKVLSRHPSLPLRDIVEELAREFGLTPEQREERHPESGAPVFKTRVTSAISKL